MSPVTIAWLLTLLISLASVTFTSSSILHPFRAPPSSRLTVSNPGVCTDDIACGSAFFCKPFSKDTIFGICSPRLSLGAYCHTHGSCPPGAFCSQSAPHICRRQATREEVCNPTHPFTCVAGLTCTARGGGTFSYCLSDSLGRHGTPCSRPGDCDQDAGFYCSHRSNTCTRKKPAGSPCNVSTARDECLGFCATDSSMRSTRGVCAPTQLLGGLCALDRHCIIPFERHPRSDRVVCNRGRRSMGICAKMSQLRTQLGDVCTLRHDLCDARRGLSCRWAPALRAAVCQHRFGFADVATPFCQRDNILSRCPGPRQLFPTECRAARAIPGKARSIAEEKFTKCRRKRRFVSPGMACQDEYIHCRAGAVCRVVPGVLQATSNVSAKIARIPALYCVRIVQFGGRCDVRKKFRQQCEGDLVCIRGRCHKNTMKTGNMKTTHAGERASCSKLPCAPGLFCDGEIKCIREKKAVAKGGLCSEPGAQCTDGLTCRTRWGPRGVKRCQWAQGVGAYCENDEWCFGKLRCPTRKVGGRDLWERRCFDPDDLALLGQPCTPDEQQSAMRCVAAGLRCLPSGSMFACMVDVVPFGLCNEKMKRVCGDSQFECRGGVCLPKRRD